MITTAIIAEFNPLHSGHKYIIDEARRITNADCIVVILSGNFTQRGDIAIAPKHVRAACAIACGADLVIELPFVYATSSAEFFASGAVTLLNSLSGIDYIVFGAENNNISMLKSAADILLDEPPLFKKTLSACLSSGMSFPAAREQAFISCNGISGIFTPNNTLAIEYIKALKKCSSNIQPIAINRIGSGYNETEYSVQKGFISASAFRSEVEKIISSPDADFSSGRAGFSLKTQLRPFIEATLPKASCDILIDACNESFPIFNDDMFTLIRYALLMKKNCLEDFCDFTPALANRVRRILETDGNNIFKYNYEDFILKLKTRDITAARIKRSMLHLLTGFTNEDMDIFVGFIRSNHIPYARLLALSSSGQSFISSIKKGCDIVLINSLGKSLSSLDERARMLINYDILSSDIYAAVVADKFNHTLIDEYRAGVQRFNHHPA